MPCTLRKLPASPGVRRVILTSLVPGSGLRPPTVRVWAKSFRGNPYDGHTLADTVARAARMTGVDPERVYRGYRGHNYEGEASVMMSGRTRGLSPQMKRELKRRSAIEATIGHMKTDGCLDRNVLKGQTGDAMNALLAAAGHNMRLILNAIAFWLVRVVNAVIRTTKTAKPNTSQRLQRFEIAMTYTNSIK